MSLQPIVRDTAPTAQAESFCLACLAPVAAFENRGGDLMHYAGDPMSDNIMPYSTDHAPFLL